MRAIVDVDGTLVDLHTPLMELLSRLYPEIPNDLEITADWNWYKKYITDEQFYTAVDVLHELQLHQPPFHGADMLFKILNKHQFEIIVASHRKPNTAHILSAWLIKNKLAPFSGVFTNYNKLDLIQDGCMVIDDAPKTIDYALQRGCSVFYLNWPWNKDKGGQGVSDLYQLIGVLDSAKS